MKLATAVMLAVVVGVALGLAMHDPRVISAVGLGNPESLFMSVKKYIQPEKERTEAEDTTRSAQLSNDDKDLVKQVQRRLKDIGLDPGPVDGIAGKRTIQAVETFQQSNNIAVNGKIDRSLLTVLDQKATSQSM